jgi:molecular chaperone DnaJ
VTFIFSIKPHRYFQRDGADLYCQIPISMVTASLGGDIRVPMIDGEARSVAIPEGTQSGRQIRIRGKGMPVLRSRDHGDLYIQVSVETPQKLTPRQRELLKEFESESSRETHPESVGFFSKMKEFFTGGDEA